MGRRFQQAARRVNLPALHGAWLAAAKAMMLGPRVALAGQPARFTWATGLLLLGSWCWAPLGAQAQEPLPGEGPGVAVGQQAPAFKLDDQAGKPVELSRLTQQGHVALVFYRSADW